jgi:hypothetical protein
MGKAGVGELIDRGYYCVDGVTAWDGVGNIVGSDITGDRFEPRQAGQLGVDFPTAAEPSEQLQRPPDGGVSIAVVADRQLSDAPLPRPACGVKGGHDRWGRFDRDEKVGALSGQPTRLASGGGNNHEVLDDRWAGQAGVGSANVLRHARMAHGDALDVSFVDDRLVEREPRRPVAGPVEV